MFSLLQIHLPRTHAVGILGHFLVWLEYTEFYFPHMSRVHCTLFFKDTEIKNTCFRIPLHVMRSTSEWWKCKGDWSWELGHPHTVFFRFPQELYLYIYLYPTMPLPPFGIESPTLVRFNLHSCSSWPQGKLEMHTVQQNIVTNWLERSGSMMQCLACNWMIMSSHLVHGAFLRWERDSILLYA